MNETVPTFAFLAVAIGVINGRGLIRTVEALAESRHAGQPESIRTRWVLDAWIGFQLVLHLALWWSIWNLSCRC